MTPGDVLHARFQVTGTWNATTLRSQVWRAGTAEPFGWTSSATTQVGVPALNEPGHVGIALGVASDWTGAAPVLAVERFTAGPQAPK